MNWTRLLQNGNEHRSVGFPHPTITSLGLLSLSQISLFQRLRRGIERAGRNYLKRLEALINPIEERGDLFAGHAGENRGSDGQLRYGGFSGIPADIRP